MEDVVLNRTSPESASSTRHERLLDHLRRHAVHRRGETPILSQGGKPIGWLIDLKGALLLGNALDDVATLFWDRFADRLPFQVGGMEVAAVPILTAIVMKGIALGHPVNGFIVRKERKRYGLCRSIEGTLTGEPIVIVDDITNSGKSLEKVRVMLEAEKRTIAAVFSVVDFRSVEGLKWRQRTRIPVSALYSLKAFGLELNRSEGESRCRDVTFDLKWKISPRGGNPYFVVPKSAPVVAGGYVYFGSDSGTFRCLRTADGQVAWEFHCPSAGRKGIWSIPCIAEDIVVFGAYDGNTYCLSRFSGEVRWVNRDADWVGSSAAISIDLRLAYIGFEYERPGNKGGLVALDLETGEKRWEVATREYLHGSPRYEETSRSVIVGTNDNRVLCVDALSGEGRWTFNTDGPVKHGIAIDDRRRLAIFGCFDGKLYGLDIDSGAPAFRIDTGNAIYSTPLVLDDYVIVGSSSKQMFSVNLNSGEVARKLDTGSKIFCSPDLIRDRIYIGTNNGSVLELDAESLEVTAALTMPDAVTNAVAYCADSDLYLVLTSMNHLHAFRRINRG